MLNIIHGDCLDKLKELKDNSVDSIVCDPPYGLSFMGKKWDYDVPSEDIWRECLRVLKPGGHLLAFAGTRTQHRMAVRIEDAGFEIRDMIAWIYGSGFPKSLNIGKALDKINGEQVRTGVGIRVAGQTGKLVSPLSVRDGGEKFVAKSEQAKQWEGWGTALKPALEPITVARKPLIGTVAENVLTHGTGGINIDQCRVHSEDVATKRTRHGGGAHSDKISQLNPDAKNTQPPGRFPANLIHDGSEEVVGLFPETGKGNGKGAYNYAGREYDNKDTSMFNGDKPQAPSNFNDSGSAARFFYCAKASKKDRDEGLEGFDAKPRPTMGSGIGGQPDQQKANNRNVHPTVKPTELMRYLCRLVTPPGGIVLDPFMGSGSTGKAAVKEGFSFIGIEREAEYVEIAKARIESCK